MAAMFGPPSLTKILVLVLIVAVVWGGFKIIGRLQEQKREEARRVARERPRGPIRKVEDMVRCKACGAYVAAGARHECEQPGSHPA